MRLDSFYWGRRAVADWPSITRKNVVSPGETAVTFSRAALGRRNANQALPD